MRQASTGATLSAVAATWQLLTDDAGERATFADATATLALPHRPAAPPNRLRHVLQIETAHGDYFLKVFRSTQWKNRVRFALTRPRARDDAEREVRVTAALRQAGFGAPRPVARGRDGAVSYYLCARLPGLSLAARLSTGAHDQALWPAAARHCGALLAAGFRLPDLSADHVYAEPDGARWRFAVLDLHNGALAAPGPPPARLCARVLRRFARSVRALPVPRLLALRFAARLLRAAHCPRPDRRRLLTAAQPFGTAARYERAGKSAAYAQRNPRRAGRELQLLARVWPGAPGETVLDAPCGTGRLLPFLAQRGHRVVQADLAAAMLRDAALAGEAAAARVQADSLQLPFADRAVDGVVMFRFLHHLPPDAARAALAEACRVARRFVVVSFFHPCSVHHLRRRLAQLAGAPATRFALTTAAVAACCRRHGFRPAGRAAELPFARDLWLAAFIRAGSADRPR